MHVVFHQWKMLRKNYFSVQSFLRNNSLEMADDDEYVGQRFFRILLPGFSSKMLIPRDFGKHIMKTKPRKMVTLVSPNGKIWHVEIYMENTKMYYLGGEGWEIFVRSINLQVGYLLILRYRGNMVLSFKVFGLSTWEKHYPSVPKKRRMNKKRTAKDNTETEHSISQKKMRGLGMIPSIKTRVKIEPAEEGKAWRDGEGQVHFEVIMKPSNFTGCFMHVPAEFKSLTGFTSDHREISITDPSGTSWLLGVVHMNQNRQSRISKGWRQFSLCNQLNIGDRVGFELVSTAKDNNKLMHLRMYKL